MTPALACTLTDVARRVSPAKDTKAALTTLLLEAAGPAVTLTAHLLLLACADPRRPSITRVLDNITDVLSDVEDCPKVEVEGAHDWEGICSWPFGCDYCAAWHRERMDDALNEAAHALGDGVDELLALLNERRAA